MNEEMRIRTSELDEARSFLEGVLSGIHAGVVVLDSDAVVRGWNRGAEDLWGLRHAEVLGQPFFSLDFGLPIAELRDLVQRVLTTREAGPPEVNVAVNRRGRTILCTVTCSPLDDPVGGVVLLMETKEAPAD